MNFLLELTSEEIPARMQAAAAEQLARRFADGLQAAGLAHGAVTADATPRRLWLRAADVAAASAASSEERKGPAATAPEAAIAGFLRGVGLTRDQLEERETPKGIVLFAHIKRDGRSAAAILAELIPAIVRDFDWPKSMRWGAASASAGSPRWVRPLTGIVALLGDTVVDCSVHGITAGRETRGHRIHAPGLLSIDSADSHAAQLLAAKVIVASAERRAMIEARAADVAAAQGLTVIPDAGLVAENAGLTEWPVPMLGSFDPAFLAVPREVIQLTMRTNQKYFACTDAAGALAPNFVCVANLDASDGGVAIIAGNERVLSARLSDAKFFWDQDVAAVSFMKNSARLPTRSSVSQSWRAGSCSTRSPLPSRERSDSAQPSRERGLLRRPTPLPARLRRVALSLKGRGKRWPPSPNRQPACARPISFQPRWASSPKCRGWPAPIWRALPGLIHKSPMQSAIITSRSGKAMTCRPRR